MKDVPQNDRENREENPLHTIIFLSVLISGFLLIHAFVVPLW